MNCDTEDKNEMPAAYCASVFHPSDLGPHRVWSVFVWRMQEWDFDAMKFILFLLSSRLDTLSYRDYDLVVMHAEDPRLVAKPINANWPWPISATHFLVAEITRHFLKKKKSIRLASECAIWKICCNVWRKTFFRK